MIATPRSPGVKSRRRDHHQSRALVQAAAAASQSSCIGVRRRRSFSSYKSGLIFRVFDCNIHPCPSSSSRFRCPTFQTDFSEPSNTCYSLEWSWISDFQALQTCTRPSVQEMGFALTLHRRRGVTVARSCNQPVTTYEQTWIINDRLSASPINKSFEFVS